MKFKMVMVTLVVVLVLVSPVTSIATASCEENSGSDAPGFENPGNVGDNGDIGAEPMGGGGDPIGGDNPI